MKFQKSIGKMSKDFSMYTGCTWCICKTGDNKILNIKWWGILPYSGATTTMLLEQHINTSTCLSTKFKKQQTLFALGFSPWGSQLVSISVYWTPWPVRLARPPRCSLPTSVPLRPRNVWLVAVDPVVRPGYPSHPWIWQAKVGSPKVEVHEVLVNTLYSIYECQWI